jgi:NADPH-dependent ferric siderophore reductase
MSRKMRMTQVHAIQDISPHMRRITLSGEDLNDFPIHQESAHVKAIFPQSKGAIPKLGLYLGAKKWMRSYTVRDFNEQTKKLTLDFAVNDHQGLATNWASEVQVGDYLGISGPGPTKHTNLNAPWHLLLADLTGLPALAAILEKLPRQAQGNAFIQIPNKADQQVIKSPKGIKINWLVNDDPLRNPLLEEIVKLTWPAGSPAIFIATQSAHMKTLKAHVKKQPNYKKSYTYASGYWKA